MGDKTLRRPRESHEWWTSFRTAALWRGTIPEAWWFVRHQPPSEILWLLRRGVLPSYYRWYQFWYRRYHAKYERSPEPILVYQLGRLGSTTVWRSLEAVTEAVVLRNHYLHPDPRAAANVRAIAEGRELDKNLRKYSKVRYIEELFRSGDGKRWKVISMVRDPGARSMSRFFHKQHQFLLDSLLDRSVEDLLPLLLERYRALEETQIREMSAWFGNNLIPVTGIDPFATEFPTDRGYEIYRGERCDLLMIRLEDLERTAAAAFGELLGIDHVPIKRSNATSEDDRGALAEVYARFRRVVRPDPGFLDRLYDIPWVRHCYTPDEIARFKARWADPRPRDL